mgnify:FL=1
MQFIRPFGPEHLHLFRKVKELGFDFIELLVPEPEDGLDPTATRKALADAGLEVVLAARVNLQRSIASNDAANRQGGLDYLKYCVEMAEAFGAKIVGGPIYGEPLVFAGRPPYPHTRDEIAQRAEWTLEGLAEAVPVAKSAGIKFALEPLNRFETDIVSTTNQAIEIVDKINNDALGILLDTFHMSMEEGSIPRAIRAAGSRVVHFQANENHRGFPGTGSMNWPETMRALSDIDYRGPISLEPFRRDDERVALPIAHWRAPHEDEDDKLRAGLGLIRSCLELADLNQ